MNAQQKALLACVLGAVGFTAYGFGTLAGRAQAERDLAGNQQKREAQARESETWKATAQEWREAAEVWRANAQACREARRPRNITVLPPIDLCDGGRRLCRPDEVPQ